MDIKLCSNSLPHYSLNLYFRGEMPDCLITTPTDGAPFLVCNISVVMCVKGRPQKASLVGIIWIINGKRLDHIFWIKWSFNIVRPSPFDHFPHFLWILAHGRKTAQRYAHAHIRVCLPPGNHIGITVYHAKWCSIINISLRLEGNFCSLHHIS